MQTRLPLAVLLLWSALPSAFCSAQVPSNALLRTRLINATSELGTAFSIDVDGRQYLVTAKHVVGSLPEGAVSEIKLWRKSGWSSIKVTVYRCSDPVDIAVLVPAAQITVDFPLEPDSKGLFAGQDAYFVGFPTGYSSPSR